MTYTISFRDIPALPMGNAAKHIRKKYSAITPMEVAYFFSIEFGIKVHHIKGIVRLDTSVEFPSEADYTFFLLRWS